MSLIPLLFALALAPQKGYVDQHAKILDEVERRYSAYAKEMLAHNIYEVMNHMAADVIWVEKHGKDEKTLDRVEIVHRLQPWIESLDPKGVLRFHVNRMYMESDDAVETEVEVQYAAAGAPFLPKDRVRTNWKENLVKIAGRWMLKRGEQVSPKDVDWLPTKAR